MKQLYIKDAAIIRNGKHDAISVIQATVFTDDDSTIEEITTEPFPEAGKPIKKGKYYVKDHRLVKCEKTGIVSEKIEISESAAGLLQIIKGGDYQKYLYLAIVDRIRSAYNKTKSLFR